jgi:pimeloyl-ACP methyl ester carboxylesterase
VLIHGFSVPYFIFDPTFPYLAEKGIRVMRYDLFGRGFSDRPRADYNLDFFVKQLSDLLDALRFPLPVNLVGLSMGGLIASAFTLHYPERVDRLALISTAGAKQVRQSPLLFASKIPYLGDAVQNLVGDSTVLEGISKDYFDPKMVEHLRDRYKAQLQFKGFKRAILSTVRNGMLNAYEDIYRQIGRSGKRMLLIWGRNDRTLPYEVHGKAAHSALPDAEFHLIEDCGHTPHYEKPDEVNPILLDFLQ